MGFDYFALGDAAIALSIPRSTLRHYCQLGKVGHKRASDGSRLLSQKDVDKAREWLKKHAAEVAAARVEVAERRAAKADFKERRQQARQLAKKA